MEDGDDDFGDLYADVEVEASSAMNTVPQFNELKLVSDETVNQNGVLEATSDKENRASDGVDVDDDDDDDEDDLDIVLNNDDDNIGHGEGCTIARSSTILRNGELDEDVDDLGREEFVGGDVIKQSLIGGGKGGYHSHSRYKYVRSQSTTHPSDLKGNGRGSAAYSSQEENGYCQRMGLKSTGPQSGQRFSLPRSRTILDVNIEIFEQRPWTQPGADITDYFNFGLNEDSWKLYCNQVDEYRHREPVLNGIPALEPAQLMERKGQAIQVENSIVERLSSMDIMRQLNRDSDVIQIKVQDPEGHGFGSIKEGLGHLDSSAPEASYHEDFSGDHGIDHLSFSSASEYESDEGNHQGMETQDLKRFSIQRSDSKPVTRGSENHDINYQCSRRAICGSEGTSDNTKERAGEDTNTCTTDPSILVTESSEDGDAYDDCKRFYSHENRLSTESFKAAKRLDDKRKHGDGFHARRSIPVYNERNDGDSTSKHHKENDESYSRRLDSKRKHGGCRYHARYNSHKDLNHKPHHGNDESLWRSPDDKRRHGEYRYYERHSSSPVYNNRTPNNDYVVRNRLNERYHVFDPYDEEHVLYLNESELPSDYYRERFSDYEDWDTSDRDLHRKGYERFGANMDPLVFRSEEEEYYGERRRYAKDDAIARDWCHDFKSKCEDEFILEREYADCIQGGKYRRSVTYNGREGGHFERGYVKHVAYTRWESRGLGRNKRFDEISKFLPKEDRPFATPSYEEGYNISSNHRPRNNLYGRQGQHMGQWTERFTDNGCLGGYSDPFDREDYTTDIDKTRHNWPSEMQWAEDENLSRCKRFVSEYRSEHVNGRKYKPKRKVKFDGTLNLRSLFMGSHLVDDPHAEGCRYKQAGEVISGDKCSSSSNLIHGKSCEQEQPSLEGKSCEEPKKHNSNMCDEELNGKIDNSRIVEAMVKMEKRRARFGHSITTTTTTTTTSSKNGTGKDSDGTTKLIVAEQQRPPRKRRWGGTK